MKSGALDFEGANPTTKNSAVRTHFQAGAKIGKVKYGLLRGRAGKAAWSLPGNYAKLLQLEAVLLDVLRVQANLYVEFARFGDML